MLSIALLVYIGFGSLLYFFQDSFLYYPTAETSNSRYQSIRLNSSDASLKLWMANPGQPRAVIYFGGNAEDAHASLPQFELMLPDHTIYAVNYRGYGGSSGSPSEGNLFKDALAVYDYIKNKHVSISAIGRSLGTGIAIHLATHRSINKLALITPYDSIASVAQRTYPVYPVSLLIRDRYDSLSMAGKLTSQTLILIAERDRIVPPPHAHKLAATIPEALLTSVTIARTGHNNIATSDEYVVHLSNFFNPDR